MTNPCEKYIFISEIDFPLGYQVANSLKELREKGKIPLFNEEFENEYKNLVLAINTRLKCLPYIIERINKKLLILIEEIKKIEDIEFGIAYKFTEELSYKLIIDIDSFIFETHSCIELLERQAKIILRNVCKQKISKEHYIMNFLKQQDKYQWLSDLKKIRHLFIHGGTPWFSICMDKEDEFDLLIMKENLLDFSNTEKFVRLSDLDNYWINFRKFLPELQHHLSDEINKL